MSVVTISASMIPDVVDVFIIWGQSNAAGTGTGAPSRTALLTPSGIIYSGGFGSTFYPVSPADTFVRLCGLETTHGALNNRGHGIELNLCFQYNQYFGKPCIVMKETEGATSLATDWASASDLRDSLINRANSMTAALTAMGKSWTIAGVFGNQWEGDTDSGAYLTNLENFVADIRTNINGNSIYVPYVHARPSTKVTATGAITNRRQAVEDAVSSIPEFSYLDQDDLYYTEPGSAPVHCDSYSQNLLAERFLTVIYPGITFI